MWRLTEPAHPLTRTPAVPAARALVPARILRGKAMSSSIHVRNLSKTFTFTRREPMMIEML